MRDAELLLDSLSPLRGSVSLHNVYPPINRWAILTRSLRDQTTETLVELGKMPGSTAGVDGCRYRGVASILKKYTFGLVLVLVTGI